jgi:hypothetical protein
MKNKSLSQFKKLALDLLAELTKLKVQREGKLYCFTCGANLEIGTSNCQLGHFLSRGAYPGMTFHPDNVRLQCMRCNCFLHGNITEFRLKLIKDIGIHRVRELEAMRHCSVKLSKSDYLVLIEHYKNEIKQYAKS